MLHALLAQLGGFKKSRAPRDPIFLREVAELHRAKISSVTCHRPDLGADCPKGSDKCNYKLIGSMFNTLGW